MTARATAPFKPAVGEAVIECLRPIREETERILKDKAYLESVYKAGAEKASYVAYGHSLVCNPWGEILTQLDEKPGVQVVDIDLGDLAKYRGQIPILSGRRGDLYRTEGRT